ncbi:hypothetical protein [Streptomyces sp. NBC_01477]|uniref:hypothetical protein n=1 Tax=Streptomyces sp. NBC_01477 TaxID=2976015 RepID=UPI002E35088D|nr:hypothetical protein [Streptomyces sp. NBC_01477]
MPSESVHTRPSLQLPTHTPVAGALRAVESFLLRGGQQTARRNAWASVVADRQRAKDRREAEYEMAALLTGSRGDAVRD